MPYSRAKQPGEVAWIVFSSDQVPVREGGQPVYARFSARAHLTRERTRPIGELYAPDQATALKRAKSRYRKSKRKQAYGTISVQSALSAAISAEDRAIVRQHRRPHEGHYYVGRVVKRDGKTAA